MTTSSVDEVVALEVGAMMPRATVVPRRSDINNLPNELLDICLSHCGKRKLLACKDVCRRWHDLSLRQIFSERPVKLCPCKAERFASSKVAPFVRHLILDTDELLPVPDPVENERWLVNVVLPAFDPKNNRVLSLALYFGQAEDEEKVEYTANKSLLPMCFPQLLELRIVYPCCFDPSGLVEFICSFRNVQKLYLSISNLGLFLPGLTESDEDALEPNYRLSSHLNDLTLDFDSVEGMFPYDQPGMIKWIKAQSAPLEHLSIKYLHHHDDDVSFEGEELEALRDFLLVLPTLRHLSLLPIQVGRAGPHGLDLSRLNSLKDIRLAPCEAPEHRGRNICTPARFICNTLRTLASECKPRVVLEMDWDRDRKIDLDDPAWPLLDEMIVSDTFSSAEFIAVEWGMKTDLRLALPQAVAANKVVVRLRGEEGEDSDSGTGQGSEDEGEGELEDAEEEMEESDIEEPQD